MTGTRVPNKSLLNLEYGENKTQGVAESREMTAQTDILTMKGSVQLPMLASSDFMNASMNFMNSDYHRENRIIYANSALLESIDLFRLPIPQDLGLGSPAAFWCASSSKEITGRSGLVFQNYKVIRNQPHLNLHNEALTGFCTTFFSSCYSSFCLSFSSQFCSLLIISPTTFHSPSIVAELILWFTFKFVLLGLQQAERIL